MLSNLKNNPKFWRYLTNFWAIVVYIAVVYDFIKNNALQEFLGPLAAIYIAILAIYAGDKEFERWRHFHQGRHPGEIFVIFWSILIFVILLTDLFLTKSYKMPGEVISTYIVVLGILAMTRKSKSLYEYKKETR